MRSHRLIVAAMATFVVAAHADTECYTDSGPAPLPVAERSVMRGIVEPFDPSPWSVSDRLEMMRFLGGRGFNTYLVAVRSLGGRDVDWRAGFSPQVCAEIARLAQAGLAAGVELGWGLHVDGTPEYSSSEERERLGEALVELHALGVRTFAVLFDRAAVELEYGTDKELYGSLAAAQADLVNHVREHLHGVDAQARLIFGPSAEVNSPDVPYVQALGELLHPSIHVLWTPSRGHAPVIAADDAQRWGAAWRRQPVLIDSYPSNATSPQRLFLGPVAGRDAALPHRLAGYLAVPMLQPAASQLALHTLSVYLRAPERYDAEQALREAVETVAPPRDWETVRLLVRWSRNSALLEGPETPIGAYETRRYWNDQDRGPLRTLLAETTGILAAHQALAHGSLRRDTRQLAVLLDARTRLARQALSLLDDAQTPQATLDALWPRRVLLERGREELHVVPWQSDDNAIDLFISDAARHTDRCLGMQPRVTVYGDLTPEGNQPYSHILDRDPARVFRSRHPARAGNYVRFDFAAPETATALHLVQGGEEHPHDYVHAGTVEVITLADHQAMLASLRVYEPWRPVAGLARPEENVLLPAEPLLAIRLVVAANQDYPWLICDVRLDLPASIVATMDGKENHAIADGDLATGAPAGRTLTVDMGQACRLGGVRLLQSAPARWELWVSTDGGSYKRMTSKQGLAVTFPAGDQPVRFVKLERRSRGATRVHEVMALPLQPVLSGGFASSYGTSR